MMMRVWLRLLLVRGSWTRVCGIEVSVVWFRYFGPFTGFVFFLRFWMAYSLQVLPFSRPRVRRRIVTAVSEMPSFRPISVFDRPWRVQYFMMRRFDATGRAWYASRVALFCDICVSESADLDGYWNPGPLKDSLSLPQEVFGGGVPHWNDDLEVGHRCNLSVKIDAARLYLLLCGLYVSRKATSHQVSNTRHDSGLLDTLFQEHPRSTGERLSLEVRVLIRPRTHEQDFCFQWARPGHAYSLGKDCQGTAGTAWIT